MKKTFPLIFLIILSSFPSLGFCLFPETEKDYRALPPFCKARSTPNSPAYQAWDKRLGNSFIHLHHYCSALHTLNVYRTDPRYNKIEKARLLESALGGIKYMEENATPTFLLFPHIYATKADIYLEQKNNGEAIRYLSKAIQTNPKFILGYTKLFDLYYKLGEKELASEILNKALAIKPQSKALNKRLAKLQGKSESKPANKI
ncbi:MAG: tetratricopeptide repeat protein [Methylococcaceae bacterium]|jgi:tetratricopeptide (TPR) repeat protein